MLVARDDCVAVREVWSWASSAGVSCLCSKRFVSSTSSSDLGVSWVCQTGNKCVQFTFSFFRLEQWSSSGWHVV